MRKMNGENTSGTRAVTLLLSSIDTHSAHTPGMCSVAARQTGRIAIIYDIFPPEILNGPKEATHVYMPGVSAC